MKQKIRKKEVQEKKKEEMKNQWQDRTSAWIAGHLINGLCYLSHTLQKQEQRLTLLQKKAILFIFCVLGSAYFLYLLSSALFRQPPLHSVHGFIQINKNDKPPPDTALGINKSVKILNHEQIKKP